MEFTDATPMSIKMSSNQQDSISFDLDPLDKQYYFRGDRINKNNEFTAISQSKTMDINIFHGIFAHADFYSCKVMANSMAIILSGSKTDCGACALAKANTKPVLKTAANRSNKPV